MSRRLLGAAAAALMLFCAGSASASVVPVTTTADGGPGSLRAALAAAGTGDTVAVPAGTYVLSSGALTIPAGVTVQGAGARATIVSGNHVSGVFTSPSGGITIADLMVTAGQSGGGAGIQSAHGLVLHRVAVVGNSVTGSGGGISVDGTVGEPLLIDHSLIADNHTGPTGTAGGIDDNSASIHSAIVDSTITGNSAGSAAGGFYVNAGTVLLDGDTVVGNSLTGASGQGGNFRVHADEVKMRNTILAGGIATYGGDCYLSTGGTLTSLGHNAEDTDLTPDSDCQGGFNATDHTGLTLHLGPLQNNGGPTDTMLPAAVSPVINTGDPAACQADDQRGVVRPQAGACDIGAAERSVTAIAGTFADGISTSGAALHASVNTAGLAGVARFAYGPTTAYGAFTAPVALAAVASAQAAGGQLAGLQPGTTYHFHLEVTTADGTFTGADAALTTASPGGGANPKPSCHVPKLKGRTLKSARRALKKAHCALGKVHKPRHSHGRLVVRRQSPAAGKVRKNGTKVTVTLRAKH